MDGLQESGGQPVSVLQMDAGARFMNVSDNPVSPSSPPSGPIVLATCSGVCNVGQLTTQAAMQIIRRSPGKYRWMKVEKGKRVKMVSPSDTVWAIVGCGDRCACRELDRSKIAYEKTVIATDLGIIRDIKAEIKFTEIDRFAEKIIRKGEPY